MAKKEKNIKGNTQDKTEATESVGQDSKTDASVQGENVNQPAPEKESELDKALKLAEDYKRKWYAVSAEYDNYRKRTAAQASQAYQDGKAEAILKLLPVSDTFGYAYDSASDEKTRAGIDKIIKNFQNILLSLGVEEIPLKPGDKFDEAIAEAVLTVPCEDGEEENTVKAILKKGYRREGKIIRFAQVTVTTEL